MNKKERTIRARGELAAKYRRGEGEFFNEDYCPLCKIHFSHSNCLGCPLAAYNGEIGCNEFRSYSEALYSDLGVATDIAFEKRAQFFDKILPILEEMPASRFTKKGWKYTGDLIPREW